MRKPSPADRGAAAVEFALVLPVLLLIVFGIIEFGILFAQQLALNSGARTGARAGVVGDKTCDQVATAAQSAAASIGMSAASITVVSSVNGASCSGAAKPCAKQRGMPLEVLLSYPGSLDIPLFGSFAVTLTGKGVYRCESDT